MARPVFHLSASRLAEKQLSLAAFGGYSLCFSIGIPWARILILRGISPLEVSDPGAKVRAVRYKASDPVSVQLRSAS